ncbi:MAG: cell division protein FtsL [Gammaproteobacteria bacterium]
MIPRCVYVTLVAAVLATALAAVMTRHAGRKQFVELQALLADRDKYLDEWGRLQLELATVATHSRIELLAHHRLGMSTPDDQALRMVVP